MTKPRIKTIAAPPGQGRSRARFSGPRPVLPPRRPGPLPRWLTLALSLLSWFLPAAPTPRALALDSRRALTQYQRRSWGQENGLPCNNVLCVTQGSDGYLWLGTEEGLVRFDGVRAQVFDAQTDPVLGGNSVASVAEDAQRPGELLLGSAGGVHRFAGGRVQTISSDAALAHQSGQVLLQDPADGALWVRTARGLFRVGRHGEVSGPVEAASGWPAEVIRTLCRDGTGLLWLGTARGIYRQHRGVVDEGLYFDLLPFGASRTVDHLAPARGGGLWVGLHDVGIGRLGADGTLHPHAELKGCLVTSLLEDRAGMLWVGTRGSGLYRVPAAGDGIVSAGPGGVEVLTADNGLVNNEINGLCEDREGNLWIATQRGLQMLRDARFVNVGRPEGLAGDHVRTVFEDRRQRLWVGNENGLGVLDLAGGGVTNYPLPSSPRRPGDSLVLCVGPGSDDDGDDTLLVGTHAGLLRWREGKLEPLPVREDLDGSIVRALYLDAAGNHWVGSDNGLYQVHGNQVLAHVTTAGGLADNLVRALHADQRGNLWIATDGGLSRLGPDGRIVNFLGPDMGRGAGSVLSFFEEPTDASDLFVGTEFGLYRLRTAADGGVQITGYTVREGLFDNVVWAMLDDDRGSLWMSSNKGVSRVSRADLDRFDRGEIATIPHVAYGTTDGMRSREGNGGHQPAAWHDHAGRLWFATVKGATCVDPAHVAPNALPPPVHVEEMVADGRVVPVVNAAPPGVAAPPLALAPGTQKLDFLYTALSLIAPEANRFRYRLEGFDSGWTDAKNERTAHYTNLPPGDYRFLVQAANADGRWNEAGAALSFRLRPFFYQSAWFQALVLAAGVTLLWTGHHWRRHRWQLRLTNAEGELRERRRNQEILRLAKEEAEGERRVAEQARTEAEMAREEAERANAAKSEFLSRMSHELRTPLNAILGFGQLLELERLPSAQGESVRHILGGGRHLLELVDEILDLARVESGEALVRPEELDLGPLLAKVAGLIEPLARERDVSLRVAPSAGPTGHVLADRRRLQQVLFNLLSNAVKYNRPGGEVTLGVQEGVPSPETAGGSRRRIFVRDTGLGIEAVGLTKLFTPFERLGAAYGPVEGTGLGLAVSKQLVEAMGGTIGVESTPGAGSNFWVELPAVPAPVDHRPAVPPLSSSAEPTVAPRPAVPSFASPTGPGGQSLLYVEDNASNRQLVESVLAQHRPDLRLYCAPDGGAGLVAALLPPRPGLILLDLQLPDMPGEEVLRRLRTDPATAGIPVVVLSADATAPHRARLRAAGAADYLTKPLELPRLLALLSVCLPVQLRPGALTRPAGALRGR